MRDRKQLQLVGFVVNVRKKSSEHILCSLLFSLYRLENFSPDQRCWNEENQSTLVLDDLPYGESKKTKNLGEK